MTLKNTNLKQFNKNSGKWTQSLAHVFSVNSIISMTKDLIQFPSPTDDLYVILGYISYLI